MSEDLFIIKRTGDYQGVNYTVIDESNNGMLIVTPTESIKNKRYPLSMMVIPYFDKED